MDSEHISQLIQLGSTKEGVLKIQDLAKADMAKNHYGSTLHKACAATLSEFLISSEIDVPVTLGAAALARRIQDRGWQKVALGHQRGGDVAVAKNNIHIFLVVQAVDNDEMIIADNQYPGPHKRKASGDPGLNHSPTAYFLRAQGAALSLAPDKKVDVDTATPDPQIFPQSDEGTDQLVEPFNDSGTSVK